VVGGWRVVAVACVVGWVGLQQLAWVWEGVQVGGKGWEKEVPLMVVGREASVAGSVDS